MKPTRRKFLHFTAGAAASTSAFVKIVRAQTYPARPVHIIVPFAAGNGPDVIARPTQHSLTHRLGQPFVIENRPGAGTNVGTEAVTTAPPDGYTLHNSPSR